MNWLGDRRFALLWALGLANTSVSCGAKTELVVPRRDAPAEQVMCTSGCPVEETAHSLTIRCTTNSQRCSPPFEVDVEFVGQASIEFTVSPVHCSRVKLRVSVDGALVHTSRFLDRGQSTGEIELPGIARGRHRVSVEAEGETGGCNVGYLGIWIGRLRVIGRHCARCGG
ncbi:MAG: hypothetical protein JNK05_03745 [Myxococcales bacterium]|nr:hypothetical protein [Myxococcales bacterium]